MRKAIKRQRDLTTKLLTYARSQCAQVVEFKDFNLKELFVEIIEELGALADDKNIDFGIEGNADITVHSDRNLLKTVLVNLCGNALKYTPDEGQVICIRNYPKFFEICVKDNGPGIPEDTKLKWFSNLFIA